MNSPIFTATRAQMRTILDEGVRFKSPLAEIEREMALAVSEAKDALVTAWVAETGIKPSESVICHGFRDNHYRVWVETKDENDKRARAPMFEEEAV